jgi:carbonic anhydrase
VFALVAALVLLPAQLSAQSSPLADVQTAQTQAAMSPDEALERLMDGNERFIANGMIERNLPEQVSDTASGQYPYAIVLGCVDSRVPPEVAFDQGIGDIFSARVAGNFVNTDILGSMEFATAVAGAPLIVVLGHSECGAIKGACNHVELGNLTHTLSNLAPAVYAVDVEGPRNSSNAAFVDAVAHTNVEMTVQNILDRSPVIADLVAKGEVKVVGAMYDVASGRVTLLD